MLAPYEGESSGMMMMTAVVQGCKINLLPIAACNYRVSIRNPLHEQTRLKPHIYLQACTVQPWLQLRRDFHNSAQHFQNRHCNFHSTRAQQN